MTSPSSRPSGQTPSASPSAVRRDGIVLGAAVGIVAVTFGVLASGAGLSIGKAMTMSLFVFTGASQFAAVGVMSAGGSAFTAVSGALLLAARNLLYGVRMSGLLRDSAPPLAVGAHFVIDETTAMATAHDDPETQRVGFWATGIALFIFWNAGTLLGAWAGALVEDPDRWGFDVAFLAAFVALIGPHVARMAGRIAAISGALIALGGVPFVPTGAPILLAALGVIPALAYDARTS